MEASFTTTGPRRWVPRWIRIVAGRPNRQDLHVACPMTGRDVAVDHCLGCPYYAGLYRDAAGAAAIKCRMGRSAVA